MLSKYMEYNLINEWFNSNERKTYLIYSNLNGAVKGQNFVCESHLIEKNSDFYQGCS